MTFRSPFVVRRPWGSLLALLLFPAAGCVTRQDIRAIQTDLSTIQQGIDARIGTVKEGTDSMQTSQADLLQEIRDLSGSLSGLKAEIDDYQQRLEKLSTRLDDLEASLAARMDAQIELLSGSKFVEKPLPSTLFNLASTDFARGKYPEAVTGFQNYLKQYPKGAQAVEAQLRIGDALLKQQDSAGAIAAYEDIIQNHPKDPLLPTALTRKASALEAAGKKSLAIETYKWLIKSYPASPEAKTALDRIHSLQADSKP